MKIFVRTFYILVILSLFTLFLYLPQYAMLEKTDQKKLNIFVWGDFFPEETFRKFEKETGIELSIHHYTSNEELILKLEKTKGKGYDLVFPSDYGVTALREKGLLKPIKKENLSFLSEIEPYLLNRPFDPENRFSIPYFWEVYGLAFERKKLPKNFEPSIAVLFEGTEKVVMTADPVEALDFASHYLYGYKAHLNEEEELAVKNLLKNQKNRVEAYTDDRVQYIISSENCPLAILRVSFFWKSFDEFSHLEIYLPKEGLFTTIENVALSAHSEHEDAAYKFLNFIYRPEIMAAQLNLSPLFPARKDALPLANFAHIKRYYEIFAEVQSRDDFFFTHYLIPQNRIRTLWVDIKS